MSHSEKKASEKKGKQILKVEIEKMERQINNLKIITYH